METIIKQLNKCLVIHYKERQYNQYRLCMKDVQKCKKELRRLYAVKDTAKDTE